MRPKDLTTDITTLTNTLTQSLTYSQHMEDKLEYIDEYTEFISEFLTEFRNDRVYVAPLPNFLINHPETRRFMIPLDPNLVGTPTNRTISTLLQHMHSFELLKDSVRRELGLNREVFIYNIYPFRHMDSDGEIRYRPIIRWGRIPMEIWYNDVPPTDPFRVIKMVKKHKL